MESMRHTWSAQLLRADQSWATSARAAAVGLALSACFGLALGSRFGPAAMMAGATGVPVGLVAITVFGGPAFFVAISHAGLPMDVHDLFSSLASCTAMMGLVLGGLSPSVVLIAVSSDSPLGAAAAGISGLAMATLLGLRHFYRSLDARFESVEKKTAARWATAAFVLFSAALASRVWWVLVPMLGRGA